MTSARIPHMAMFDASESSLNNKVQGLASSVYKEFEGIIGMHGSEAVKGLMPVVVNILENLDQNLKEKQQFEVDLELSKVEVEHLKKQFEKEKALRRSTDTRFLEAEDMLEETKKQLSLLKNSSELVVKRLEMKVKKLQEQVGRLEEKDNHNKEEYSRLHLKYSELLKNHTDYVQKSTKLHHSIDNNDFKKTRVEYIESSSSTPRQNSYMNHHFKVGSLRNEGSNLSLNSLSDIQVSSSDHHNLSSTHFYSLLHENYDSFSKSSTNSESPPSFALATPTNFEHFSSSNTNHQNCTSHTTNQSQVCNLTPTFTINSNPVLIPNSSTASDDMSDDLTTTTSTTAIHNQLTSTTSHPNSSHHQPLSELASVSTTTYATTAITTTFDNTTSSTAELTNHNTLTTASSTVGPTTSETTTSDFNNNIVTSLASNATTTNLPINNTTTILYTSTIRATPTTTTTTTAVSSNSASQEDLNNKNNNVDVLFGECMLASNQGFLHGQKYLKSVVGFLGVEEDVDGGDKGGYDGSGGVGFGERCSRGGRLGEEEVGNGGELQGNVSLYEELSVLDEDNDILSVGAEVDKLIQENNELLATKNALNVLKDDLISEVEELSGEVELLREEVGALQSEKVDQNVVLAVLEEEVRRLKGELSSVQARLEEKERSDKDSFSRVELVRVLMERNQYKEKLMELQEAVRWAETLRAKRTHPEMTSPSARRKQNSNGGVWGMFNSFLGLDKEEN